MREIVRIRARRRDISKGGLEPLREWVRPIGSNIVEVAVPLDDSRGRRFVRRLRFLNQALARSLNSSAWAEREYDKKELDGARLLRIVIESTFEPCGEDCQTRFDSRKECANCLAGRVVIPPLRLRKSTLPRNADIAQTIAMDEWVITRRLGMLLRKAHLTGFTLGSIACGGRASVRDWRHLVVHGDAGYLVQPSSFGSNPVDLRRGDDRLCKTCRRGRAGILISEAYVSRAQWDKSDVCITRDVAGLGMGCVRPSPELFVSQRAYAVLRKANARGFRIEVAHVV